MRRIILLLAVTGCIWAPAHAQEAEPEFDEPDILFVDEAPEAVVPDDPLDVATNLETILNRAGDTVGGWRRSTGCVGEVCGELIAHAETGEIALFDGAWMGGFVQTGRGEEVVRIRPPDFGE